MGVCFVGFSWFSELGYLDILSILKCVLCSLALLPEKVMISVPKYLYTVCFYIYKPCL